MNIFFGTDPYGLGVLSCVSLPWVLELNIPKLVKTSEFHLAP